jgi:hypothetical protein
MASEEKSLEPYEFETMSDLIFRSDIDRLSFTQLAAASSSCAVVGDHLATRRKRIAARIADKIEERETDGIRVSRSDSGKSLRAEISNITLRRTEKGGGFSYNVESLQEMLEEKGIEVGRVIKPTREKIDEDALETLMVKHGIPREQIYIPVDPKPDTAIVEALVAAGYLTQDEVDSVCESSEPSVTVTCSFDKNTKHHFLMTLEAKEGEFGKGSDR